MPELRQQMRLYHGSYCKVSSPDLSKCSRYKDFGQGFYHTSSIEQARSFAKISTGKAIARDVISHQNYGVVSTFICVDPGSLVVCDYQTADVDWLHCVAGHRRNLFFPEVVREMLKYDVISGKIANDDTNVTITAYLDGVFGETGSAHADDICISLLLPERLQDQFCFRTNKALKTLVFKGSESVWL